MAGRIAYYGNISPQGLVLNLDAGIVGSYPKTGSTWFDISNNGNNGTLTNGPTFTGSDYGAIVFDGTNDYIDCGNNSSLNIVNSLTIEAWVNPSAFSPTGVSGIGGKWGLNSGRSYKIAILTASRLFYIDVSNTGLDDNYRVSNTAISANTWTHVVGTYTSGSLNVYINGALDNGTLVGTIPSSLNSNTSSLSIGTDPTNYFTGRIPNFKIYNRVLTQTEIQQNFNALRGRYGI
jgi:hypothetical protein